MVSADPHEHQKMFELMYVEYKETDTGINSCSITNTKNSASTDKGT